MRDINRIDSFCDKIKEYWKRVPDWRFGQLISNVYSSGYIHNPFYMEEEETLELFENFFKGENAHGLSSTNHCP